jgi:hypothetical protein
MVAMSLLPIWPESLPPVMTISLVLFDGRRAAERTHHKILKALYPDLAHNAKALNDRR